MKLDPPAKLLEPSRRPGLWAIASAILVAVAPKCPLCWAAYMSAFGSLGISIQIPYQPWLLPLVAGLLLVNLAALLLRARARRRYGPFSLCLAGVAAVIVGKFVLVSGTPFMTLGLAAIISGSLWSAHGKRAQVEAAGACCCGSRESLASRRS